MEEETLFVPRDAQHTEQKIVTQHDDDEELKNTRESTEQLVHYCCNSHIFQLVSSNEKLRK
jgi:hypothetical protein